MSDKSETPRMVQIPSDELARITRELTAARLENERLRGVLVSIRDSTFKNAVTLRGMADSALQHGGQGEG